MQGNPIVCCSSPELFLRLTRDGVLEARPIKGTAARDLTDARKDEAAAKNLAASEKDRAENLMIVDLLRNDLGRVCASGSVHVPSMMQVSSSFFGKERGERTFCMCSENANGHLTGYKSYRLVGLICPNNILPH
jgi:hypothetical protein